jgi:hypothetical protein
MQGPHDLSLVTQLFSISVHVFADKYGKIVDIDLKLPPRPPAYAFVEVFLSAPLAPLEICRTPSSQSL